MKNTRFILLTLLAIVTLAITGFLLLENNQLDLPIIEEHQGKDEESSSFLAIRLFRDEAGDVSLEAEHDHEEGEEGQGGGGHGNGMGNGQGRGRLEGGGGHQGDIWDVLSDFWLLATFFIPVIIIDKLIAGGKARKRKVRA